MSNPKLIVGLGNFGSEYDGTYHNVGFSAVDRLLDKIGERCAKKECKSLTCHARVDGCKVIIAKPQTYMNLSGEAVEALAHRYKIEHKDIVVLCDDIDLRAGATRFRERGSGGTHNGLRNIVSLIGEDFCRLRIGIGRPPIQMDLASYVLSKINSENASPIFEALDRAVVALLAFAAGDPLERIGAYVNVR